MTGIRLRATFAVVKIVLIALCVLLAPRTASASVQTGLTGDDALRTGVPPDRAPFHRGLPVCLQSTDRHSSPPIADTSAPVRACAD